MTQCGLCFILGRWIRGRVFPKEVMVWRVSEFRKSSVRVAFWREDGRKVKLNVGREVRACSRNRRGIICSPNVFHPDKSICGEGIWKDRRMNGGFTVFFVAVSSACREPRQIFRVCALLRFLDADFLGWVAQAFQLSTCKQIAVKMLPCVSKKNYGVDMTTSVFQVIL